MADTDKPRPMGRPWTGHTAHPNVLPVRYTDDEYAAIKKAADDAGLRYSEYVRERSLGRRVRPRRAVAADA